MVLDRLFGERPHETAARALYAQIVGQAREPVFYRSYGVPDTLDGRFEMIALHICLLLYRLKLDHPQGAQLGQCLHDVFFADMDESLREMGAGDLGVGKRVRRMAVGLRGRIGAYDPALSAPSPELEETLARNLYGTCPEVPPEAVAAMATYARRASEGLARQSLDDLLAGQVALPPAVARQSCGDLRTGA